MVKSEAWWVSLLILVPTLAVTMGISAGIDWVTQWRAEKVARWETHAEFRNWFRVYMAIAHHCGERILNPLWLADEGDHGRTEADIYEDLIRDVCLFLKARGFSVQQTGNGWRASQMEWFIFHPDHSSVTIFPEDKLNIWPSTIGGTGAWGVWAHFRFRDGHGATRDEVRGGSCGPDGEPIGILEFRKRLWDALRLFVGE
jgi:hypothetical protein